MTPIEPVIGHVEFKKGNPNPHLFCSNIDEHVPREMILIFSNFSTKALLERVEADGFLHYRHCIGCKKEVVWARESLLDHRT
jgi:hypothetical protein